MRFTLSAVMGLALASSATTLQAQPAHSGLAHDRAYLQCVPYARTVSGISLRGDAWTWWDQAQGRYARGAKPRIGAVMAFSPYGRMVLGHVAAVSGIVDRRTILLRHANWSPVHGRRGQRENDVVAVDVSPANDWSAVRVWFDPIKGLGATAWPVRGFIYNQRPGHSGPAPYIIPQLDDPIGSIIARETDIARAEPPPRISLDPRVFL